MIMSDDFNLHDISWEKFFDIDSVHSCRTAYGLPCNNCQYYDICTKCGINKDNFYDKFADRYNIIK